MTRRQLFVALLGTVSMLPLVAAASVRVVKVPAPAAGPTDALTVTGVTIIGDSSLKGAILDRKTFPPVKLMPGDTLNIIYKYDSDGRKDA